LQPEAKTYITSDLIAAGHLAIGDGYRAKNAELSLTGIPFARAGDIDKGFHFEDADRFPEEDLRKVGEKISRPGDVVFTSKGTVGRFAFVREDTPRFVFSPQLCYWRSLNSNVIDPKYLYYWMNSREFWVQASAVKGQTDMADYVSLTDQRRMRITLRHIEEQRAITRILGALDDKIDINRQMNHTLEAMAQAIFKSWFVDFDPVTAKADSRQPYGMNAEIAALFPSRFVESELGAVPEGWPVKTLPEIIEVNPKRELANGTSAQYLEMANMPTKGHTPNTWTIRSAGSGMRFMNGDTLMARITPCLENGKTAYVDFLADGEIAWGSTEYIVLRPKEPLPPVYGYCVARWDDFRDFSIAAMTGSSGRQRVPASNLKFFKMVMPGERVARKFGELVTPLFEKARANTNESITLAKLRDLLLPKLLSGEIRVNQAEKLVEEVA